MTDRPWMVASRLCLGQSIKRLSSARQRPPPFAPIMAATLLMKRITTVYSLQTVVGKCMVKFTLSPWLARNGEKPHEAVSGPFVDRIMHL